MRLYAALALSAVIAVSCVACMTPYIGPVPVPPAPTPTPAPNTELTRASFDAVTVGASMDVLNELPTADYTAQVGDRAIYSWDLNERRPSGGWVQWEVHITGGKVVSSHAW